MKRKDFEALKPGDRVLVLCDNLMGFRWGYLPGTVVSTSGDRASVMVDSGPNKGNGAVVKRPYRNLKHMDES